MFLGFCWESLRTRLPSYLPLFTICKEGGRPSLIYRARIIVNTYLKHIFEFFSTLHSWLTRLSHRTTLNRQKTYTHTQYVASFPVLHRGSPTLVMSYHQHVILIVKLIANLLHSIASRTISEHQKLLACWVHSGWGAFSTILKLSIRSRSITAVYLALNSHLYAIWRSQATQCYL